MATMDLGRLGMEGSWARYGVSIMEDVQGVTRRMQGIEPMRRLAQGSCICLTKFEVVVT